MFAAVINVINNRTRIIGTSFQIVEHVQAADCSSLRNQMDWERNGCVGIQTYGNVIFCFFFLMSYICHIFMCHWQTISIIYLGKNADSFCAEIQLKMDNPICKNPFIRMHDILKNIEITRIWQTQLNALRKTCSFFRTENACNLCVQSIVMRFGNFAKAYFFFLLVAAFTVWEFTLLLLRRLLHTLKWLSYLLTIDLALFR